MSNNDYHDMVLSSLATLQTDVSWVLRLGSVLVLAVCIAAGTLWMRTETNMIGVSQVQAAVTQHYEEVPHASILK